MHAFAFSALIPAVSKNETRSRSYKQKSCLNYAGFSFAENLVGYFPLKIFSVAKSCVSYAGFLFIGSDPDPDSRVQGA